jgi:hypothetical protein
MKLTGENRSTRRKTCPSATLPTTNPTCTDPRSNPDLRGERPVTNRLSHGTAYLIAYSSLVPIQYDRCKSKVGQICRALRHEGM